MSKPTIFISYSHKDEKWKDRLVTQLGVLQPHRFEVWTDREIGAGEDWHQKIDDALQKASVAILLVSPDSLTSTFILKEEMARLLKRRDQEGLRIVPIIIRDCPWEAVEWLARMQVRPRGACALRQKKPAQVEKELTEIVKEIASIIARSSTPTTGN